MFFLKNKKIKELEERIEELEKEVKTINAKLFYLRAPDAFWNKYENTWWFFPNKKKVKKKKFWSLFGEGEILQVEKDFD